MDNLHPDFDLPFGLRDASDAAAAVRHGDVRSGERRACAWSG
jgi:hypothetical protein